ncbi:MAG: hypothetical protein AVDCRST_MAG25-3045, partial [uncultured Rubrobacteraceae bacterium]
GPHTDLARRRPDNARGRARGDSLRQGRHGLRLEHPARDGEQPGHPQGFQRPRLDLLRRRGRHRHPGRAGAGLHHGDRGQQLPLL